MSLEEKVRLIVDDPMNSCCESALEDAIIDLVKEQDKATRLACAEAVINVSPISYSESNNANSQAINASKAHTACMNVKAI